MLSPMLLAVDTATATASVALYALTEQTLLAEWTWQARRRHTQELLLAVQTLLAQVGAIPAEIRAVAATTGPGSFTGVRIGLSVLKGIGLGLASPPQAVGLPTLSVTAAPWLAVAQASRASVWAYLQAGRGRYNWASFAAGYYLPTAEEHHAGTAVEFAEALGAADASPIWLVGEATPELTATVAPLPQVTLVDGVSAGRRAGVLAHLAAQRLAAGHADDLAALQPLYLQGP
jgi:tRNA threonylcarbamoyladenosine biosynthesis protein TsaB